MKPTETKKEPSYLSKARNELLEIIVTNHAADRQEAKQITQELWPFFRKHTIQSYYNGVRDGFSKKVKPKG